ncbi:MAG: type II toxin-antitoxin system VapC family toxin [Nitrospirae bacterium]|nr:type II toxin-antitoxin system VapC family toxin [Nitrospirota bacterium]
MRKYLLDTNIISYYLKGIENFKEKISGNIDLLSIPIISYYEIVSGLQSIDANKRIAEFEKFCELIDIINLDKASISASCKIYASLKKSGRLIDDIDILIAGIALSNNFVMVTDNIEHFGRIEGLKVENWKN